MATVAVCLWAAVLRAVLAAAMCACLSVLVQVVVLAAVYLCSLALAAMSAYVPERQAVVCTLAETAQCVCTAVLAAVYLSAVAAAAVLAAVARLSWARLTA